MALLTGLILGFAIGLALVFGFVMSENRRAHSRQLLAVSTSSLSKLTPDGMRRIFSNYALPSWVVFPRRQKVSWLNHELRKVWPYVDEAASAMAKAVLEPVLEQYRPTLISSLKFDKFTLGTVAPQFVGVEMVENTENEITMELELEWDGNPSIILGVVAAGVSLPVQIKNLAFAGTFRVVLKPLVDELPCFGAIMYSLRVKKNLDFKLKVIGGDVGSLPGLSGAISGMIRTALTDSLLWPARQVIPIIPGDYTDMQLRVVGKLEVKVVQAKDLQNKDLFGKSDPYAVVFIRPIPNRIKRTKTLNNELHPIWNEKFVLDVEEPLTQQLTVHVFDDEGMQSDQLLGGALLPLKDLEVGVLKEFWLTLVKDLENTKEHKYRGQIQIELLYHEFGKGGSFTSSVFKDKFPMTSLETMITMNGHPASNDTSTAPVATKSPSDFASSRPATAKHEDDYTRGVLSVSVLKAENLISTDYDGASDPYANVRMKKGDQKMKTKVAYKTLNPEWNQTFDFVVEDAVHDMLIIEVWDHDTFGKDYMGRCALTLSRVLYLGEYDAEYQLDGVKSGKIFLHLKWTEQPIASHFGRR